MMPRRSHLDKKTVFLKAFIETGSIKFAARCVPVDRGEHYDWLKKDADYRARFDAAKSKANVRMSADALRTARKARALRDIADGGSVRLLEQIADLINASLGKRAAKADETFRGEENDLFDRIARDGVFGKRYKDFRSAPPAAQQTIRAIAAHLTI